MKPVTTRKRIGWRYLLLTIIWILADQMVKQWTQLTLPLYETRSFLPGIMELTHVQNTGAAFSLFSDHTWLLALLSGIAALVLLVLLVVDYFPHTMARLALALVLGGAVGNLIDRVFLGYVVDMFSTTFVQFAIFNVADIGVTIGGLLLVVYILFFWHKQKALPPKEHPPEQKEADA